MTRFRVGISLVEVLVAVAIAVVVLGLLVGGLSSARQAHRTVDEASEAAATLRLATELLREELLLAGSAPWPVPAAVTGVPAGQTPVQFVNTGVHIGVSGSGHSLRLVYIDDRLSGGLVARDLTFEAGVDGQGLPQLYRRSGTSPRQPWVAGVDVVAVEGGIGADGVELSNAQLFGVAVRALWLRFEAHGTSDRVLLELPHVPLVVAP